MSKAGQRMVCEEPKISHTFSSELDECILILMFAVWTFAFKESVSLAKYLRINKYFSRVQSVGFFISTRFVGSLVPGN